MLKLKAGLKLNTFVENIFLIEIEHRSIFKLGLLFLPKFILEARLKVLLILPTPVIVRALIR